MDINKSTTGGVGVGGSCDDIDTTDCILSAYYLQVLQTLTQSPTTTSGVKATSSSSVGGIGGDEGSSASISDNFSPLANITASVKSALTQFKKLAAGISQAIQAEYDVDLEIEEARCRRVGGVGVGGLRSSAETQGGPTSLASAPPGQGRPEGLLRRYREAFRICEDACNIASSLVEVGSTSHRNP